ncbi:MAG: selenocysteine-specific translation elongation factor [Gammaproteobacteria bacterium]
MIIGTAGHIDHGKTALIKALTGIDADRLAEEKRRGMTIDLGYAYHELPDGNVMGFVDVPGHEKFVHNMLSGALGIDYVLLVIAADDGPMPQTREHLAIVDLLAMKEGVVALSKIDLVTPAHIEETEHAIRSMLAGTSLAGADVMRVSTKSGSGLDALYKRLAEVARIQSPRASSGQFRLAVDRSFSVRGAGTVVTGTVHAGTVRPDDRLTVSPAGLSARVRSIRCQNKQTSLGRAGDRCALNLAGANLDARAIQRGDWILAPVLHRPSARLDCRLHILLSEPRPLRHWTPVHVHVGAADISGRVAVLEKESIDPGASGLVQIVLDKPIPALHGDRLILRDQSALRTVGGGYVLDPTPPARGRRKPYRLASLAALEQPAPAEALERLLDLRGATGLDLDWFGFVWNLRAEEFYRLQSTCEFHVFEATGNRTGIKFAAWQALRNDVIEALAEHHRRAPNETGITEGKLRQLLRDQAPGALVKLAVNELIAEGAILRHGALLHLPGHVDRLSPIEENLWRRLYAKIDAGGLRPPRPRELAEMFREDRTRIKALLKRQAKAGKICEISDELYYPLHTIAELAATTEALCNAQNGNPITMRIFREGTGIDRNVTIEVLEYFDRVGLTLRVNNGRRLQGTAAAIFGARDSNRVARL